MSTCSESVRVRGVGFVVVAVRLHEVAPLVQRGRLDAEFRCDTGRSVEDGPAQIPNWGWVVCVDDGAGRESREKLIRYEVDAVSGGFVVRVRSACGSEEHAEHECGAVVGAEHIPELVDERVE